MTEVRQILMMGLPGSGKTTYLAALYNLLRAPEPTLAPTSLLLRSPPVERDYFHDIERAWLNFELMLHSKHIEPKETKLELKEGDKEIDVELPDVSGEQFDALWEHGAWNDRVLEFASEARGLLLFVRADAVKYPALLEPPSADGLAKSISDNFPPVEPTPDQELELEALRKRVAEEAPTQTKLADLLEGVWAEMPVGPVAVIISAWDTVSEMGLSPKTWLEVNLPLLWQMLMSNSDQRAWRAFGVSAQGGDVSVPETRDELARRDPPASRVLVVDEFESSDLTVPLKWLLEAP
jgi:hypothetical protein